MLEPLCQGFFLDILIIFTCKSKFRFAPEVSRANLILEFSLANFLNVYNAPLNNETTPII